MSESWSKRRDSYPPIEEVKSMMDPEVRAERVAKFRAMVEAVQATPVVDAGELVEQLKRVRTSRDALAWLVANKAINWNDAGEDYDEQQAMVWVGACSCCAEHIMLPDWVRDVLRSVEGTA